MSAMDGHNSQRQEASPITSMADSGQKQRMLNDLPPTETKRWVIRRKAAVVTAVKNGAIALDDVCWLYNISVEEFLTWQEMIEKHGNRGLSVTKLKDFRVS